MKKDEANAVVNRLFELLRETGMDAVKNNIIAGDMPETEVFLLEVAADLKLNHARAQARAGRHAERARAVKQAILQRLDQDPVLRVHLYCDDTVCPMREIDCRMKDHDNDFELFNDDFPRGLVCPLCGTTLKLHDVHTNSEDRRQRERNARVSVNQQMYERDYGPLVPIQVLVDDRLPPTPSDWWVAYPERKG